MAEHEKSGTPKQAADAAHAGEVEDALPIHLVDLGKAKGKAIKQLKRGGGKLHHAVLEALDDVVFELGEEADGKTILPVVLVVEKKAKRRSPFALL